MTPPTRSPVQLYTFRPGVVFCLIELSVQRWSSACPARIWKRCANGVQAVLRICAEHLGLRARWRIIRRLTVTRLLRPAGGVGQGCRSLCSFHRTGDHSTAEYIVPLMPATSGRDRTWRPTKRAFGRHVLGFRMLPRRPGGRRLTAGVLRSSLSRAGGDVDAENFVWRSALQASSVNSSYPKSILLGGAELLGLFLYTAAQRAF